MDMYDCELCTCEPMATIGGGWLGLWGRVNFRVGVLWGRTRGPYQNEITALLCGPRAA